LSNIPELYRWLDQLDPLPRMVREALRELGVAERAGAANNPVVMGWAKEVGADVAREYWADSVPWCGLFMAVIAKRAGKPVPAGPLWAMSWKKFGMQAAVPSLGDILVFRRESGGHVGLYVGEDDQAFHVLGGNQSDRVGFTRIARARMVAARRPVYRAAPSSARPFRLAATGALSTSER